MVGIKALEVVKLGRTCQLVRPFYSTTAQIKTLLDVLPVPSSMRRSAARLAQVAKMADSIKNLKQIGIAIQKFQAANNSYPPAVMYGPDGKPWHSWRVLILPYLNEGKLYNAYDFSQPWDSEKNLKVLDSMPDVYHDPIYGADKGQFTNYAMLIGDWKGPTARFKDRLPTIRPAALP